MKPKKNIHVLIAEDDPASAIVIEAMLKKLDYTVVGTAKDGEATLEAVRELEPDVILMDVCMPEKDGIQATREIQQLRPTPVVILTASDTQENVADASAAGAGAYLIKPPEADEIERAITIAMARFDDMVQLRRLNEELHEALDKVKTLSGLLPICSACKKIRDDKGYWTQVEVYIEDRSEAEFTHGMCRDCAKKLYPDLYE